MRHPEEETIIRFSSGWWGYLFCRLGILRALVNGVEDALAITGRFLLLVFLIYCGAEAGILLSEPTFSFPGWLQMSMFCLQLAGLEGSIPGLARQAGSLRRHNEEQGAKQVEAVMLSARVMTVLSIGEGALHALHVPPTALQIISALLLIVRGIVITGFLIALAKVESRAPRILSREAHTREVEQQAQRDEQARTMAALRDQVSSGQREVDRLGVQLDTKGKEVDSLRGQVSSGQAEVSSLHAHLDTLHGQVDRGQAEVDRLQRQLQRALAELDEVHAQVSEKQRELEDVQRAVDTEQQRVSSWTKAVDTGQSIQVSTGQGKVVHLDTNRARTSGQQAAEQVRAQQIRELLKVEPGLSARAIATRLGCSPTTVAKWKATIEQEPSRECVNE